MSVSQAGKLPIRVCPYCGIKLREIINFAETNLHDGLYINTKNKRKKIIEMETKAQSKIDLSTNSKEESL